MRFLPKATLVLFLPAFISGCVGVGENFETDLGFSLVAGQTAQRLGKETVWVQDRQQAAGAKNRVDQLLKAKYVGVDAAIQVAILNNKGLQAAYADIGMSVADLWQEGMAVNPTLSASLTRIGVGPSIEGVIAANIIRLMTRERRLDVAEVKVMQAQLRAVDATLSLAAETRAAWIEAVGAWEEVGALTKAKIAADAAAELGDELAASGALPKVEQIREQAFYAEITGQKAKSRLAAQLAKEKLYRVMGVWGKNLDFEVPNALPPLPGTLKNYRTVEAEALKNRVDLQVARLELESLARSYGLTQATRYASDLEIAGGLEVEREVEEEEDGSESASNTLSGIAEVSLEIPIFDSGQARLRKAEFAYLKAANQVAAKAVDIRSQARAAYKAYKGRSEIARFYRGRVVPLRTSVEKESLLTYNGMITSTFDLLADTRAKIGAILASIEAKRDFHLADAALAAAVYGGSDDLPASGGDEVADAGGGDD
ncbi:TolC family protein [Fulvimarina sp. 2208YS6-2-32]|uniref:TolC family protein n=1 Tax=Fulvimarina uroteuthidis TaxID=3098149 RepID=A0ABU5I690_9HYPH|nr:TolC family protein [Fulvimarina sp. 2208YS6-2-32]MDY8110897.1 TolC family protein [Fulvimarina sp. 2208YS6-2-32]